MIIAPSGLISNMDSMTRNPTAKLFVSWDTVLLSGEWFRLDQSQLDTGAILSQYEYEEGDSIIEGLSSIDSRIYEDESDYLVALEGFAELIGDSYQYSISDMDLELDNTNNRYTPRENKNKLDNPGFEFNKNSWNEIDDGAEIVIDEDSPNMGLRDLQINNAGLDSPLVFSNVVPIYSSDGYNITPTEEEETWSLSFYVLGSGVVNLNLMAYGLSASGVNDITTGYLTGSAFQKDVSFNLVDSYSEINQNSGSSLLSGGRGQTFTGDGGRLNSVKFFLKSNGSPTGNISAKVYAHTGTYGTDGTPTGSQLAISDGVDVTTISSGLGLITFNFSGLNKITLSDGVHYCVYLDGIGSTQDLLNNIYMGFDSTSPTHSGNYIYKVGVTWYSQDTTDVCFYVYSDSDNEWQRIDTKLNVPIGTSYLRAVLSTSGTLMKFDDGQLEQAPVITDIEDGFVGDLILPKRAIRAEVGFNNYNIPKFTGLINKFIPSISKDTTQVYAYDMADRLKDIIVEDKYFENKRTDELIIELASIAGIGVEQLSLETGTNTIEFAYFQEASVWTYMNQIAESEGGRVFFDESGKLIFWNRNHYRDNTDIAYTFNFDNNITDLTYEISKLKVKNRIYIKAYPKKKLSDVKIYNDTSVPSVSAGDTQEFFCQYNYLQEQSVPALNVQVPVIGTDIIANTAEDGSGSDISSDVSISSYFVFRESMRINLYNANAATAYLTDFRIYGDPIVIARRIEEIQEDTNSQAIYDVQELQIENNFITTDAFAETLAMQKLSELKDSRDFIKIEAIGVPYLQLGDMVRVQRSFDGTYENFHIVKNSWSFRDDFMQTLELEKKVIT